MKVVSITRPNEQRKVEQLLAKLAKIKPLSAKPAPVISQERVLRSA